MPETIYKKLKIKPGMSLLTLHAPENFSNVLGNPVDVKISSSLKNYDQVHWFVSSKSQLEKELDKVLSLLKENITCWIYYPKKSSKKETDLTRDKGWDALLSHKELQWLSLISFDDTWSAFAMRLKTEADKKKEIKPAVREIFNYVDPASKTVKLPKDLSEAFKKNRNTEEVFNRLSFTNKKEYIEWIISAKKDETRKQRVEDSITRLNKSWKNPRNM